MEFAQIVAKASDFIKTYPLIGVAVLVVVGFFAFKSTKEFLKFLVFLAVMALVAYFVLQLNSTTTIGVNEKKEMSNKTQKALGE